MTQRSVLVSVLIHAGIIAFLILAPWSSDKKEEVIETIQLVDAEPMTPAVPPLQVSPTPSKETTPKILPPLKDKATLKKKETVVPKEIKKPPIKKRKVIEKPDAPKPIPKLVPKLKDRLESLLNDEEKPPSEIKPKDPRPVEKKNDSLHRTENSINMPG